jgi:hypothetical protein
MIVYVIVGLLYLLAVVVWSAGALSLLARSFCGAWPPFRRAAGLAAIGLVLSTTLAIIVNAVVEHADVPAPGVALLLFVVFAAPHALLARLGLRRADGTRPGGGRAAALAAVHAPVVLAPQVFLLVLSIGAGG